MEKIFVQNTMFLSEHKAISEYAKQYSLLRNKNLNEQWTIVCERKEDLKSVRNQLFFSIGNELEQNELASIAGISMYTLDNLARHFASTLCATPCQKLRQEFPKFLAKPYLDIVSQEHFVKILLNLYGYLGSDSLALAKQILTFIDLNWPADSNFIQLIMSTQDMKTSHSVQEISEISLKQILATYQYAKFELENYCRLQNLVKEYLQNKFITHLHNSEFLSNLVLPSFLTGHILWISAPEYSYSKEKISDHHQYDNNKISQSLTVKPANFQSVFVEEFKMSILRARGLLNYSDSKLFYYSQTIIENIFTHNSNNDNHIKYFVAENRTTYSELTKNILNENNKFCLLGDFSPGSFLDVRSDAGGDYKLIEKDLLHWKNNNKSFFQENEIYPQISEIFNDFLEKISFIQNEEKRQDIAKIYSLQISSIFNEEYLYKIFFKLVEKETVHIAEPHPLVHCHRTLSFLNSYHLPQKIIVIGRAHAPTASSFLVKVLNNAIFNLKKEGVIIDIPASEIMYRGFWKSITNLNVDIEFWLSNSSELENFPEYLKPQGYNIFMLGEPFPPLPQSNLEKSFYANKLLNSNWKALWLNSKKQHVSVTEFEQYVHCPLQFYLHCVLGIEKEDINNFAVNYMSIGIQMHYIAEQFMTRIVTSIGNSDYSKEMAEIYNVIINEMKNQELFLSQNKNKWIEFFTNAIKNTKHSFQKEITLAFNEAIENIWVHEHNQQDFNFIQEREILKRTFLRFLKIEQKSIQENMKKKVAIERESIVEFKLNGLKISGKIDRVDLTNDGFQIIDYKTSKIPQNEVKLVLLPSETKCEENSKEKNVKLSIQGGVYSLAWVQKKYMFEEEDNEFQHLKKFSLYRLKSLDEFSNPILEYIFEPPLKYEDDTFFKLVNEYSVYADNLLCGNFNPNPVQKVICDFCDFQSLCPIFLNKTNEEK